MLADVRSINEASFLKALLIRFSETNIKIRMYRRELEVPRESLRAFQLYYMSSKLLILMVAEEGLEPPTRGL